MQCLQRFNLLCVALEKGTTEKRRNNHKNIIVTLIVAKPNQTGLYGLFEIKDKNN